MKALWSTSWPTRGGRTRKGQEGRGTEERGQWWWCGPMDPLGWGQGVVPEAGFQGFASRLELDWGASTYYRSGTYSFSQVLGYQNCVLLQGCTC